MLKQTFKIVSYLIIALFFGIIITLIADSIENVTVEKRVRTSIEDNIRNAVASFNDSAPEASAADEIVFVKKYALNVTLGAIVNLTDDHHLLFSGGCDIHGENRFSAYLAYQYAFGTHEEKY